MFDPATVIQDDWIHLALNGKTDYRIVYLDRQLAIRAAPRDGASGLIRRVSIDSARWPVRTEAGRSVRDPSTVAGTASSPLPARR